MGLVAEPEENHDYHVNSQFKHYILQDYLSAWLPIMSSVSDSLTYTDCFAGPGTCSFNGTLSPGSPLVALQTINRFLRDAPSTVQRPSSVNAVFVDYQARTCEQLKTAIDRFAKAKQLDPRVSCSVLQTDAQSALVDILCRNLPTVPAFYFIDPNYRLPDMSVMQNLLSRPKTEVFMNFMFYQVVRNMPNPLYHDDVAAFLGDNSYETNNFSEGSIVYDWKKVVDFYFHQTGARYYIPFRVCFGPDEDIRLRGRLKYVLIHLSNHFKAFDKMLSAMYKNSESGNSLQVSLKQPTLFPTLDEGHLDEQVRGLYSGTGTTATFDALRQKNWRLYASEQMWRQCLKALRTDGVVVSHHMTSKTDVGLKGNDIVEFRQEAQ